MSFSNGIRHRLFVYRQTWRGRKQDGLVAACSVDDYDANAIKTHEKTRAVQQTR